MVNKKKNKKNNDLISLDNWDISEKKSNIIYIEKEIPQLSTKMEHLETQSPIKYNDINQESIYQVETKSPIKNNDINQESIHKVETHFEKTNYDIDKLDIQGIGDIIYKTLEEKNYYRVDKLTGMLLELDRTIIIELLKDNKQLYLYANRAYEILIEDNINMLKDLVDIPPYIKPTHLDNTDNGTIIYQKLKDNFYRVEKITAMLLELDKTIIIELVKNKELLELFANKSKQFLEEY